MWITAQHAGKSCGRGAGAERQQDAHQPGRDHGETADGVETVHDDLP
jgi:hypothetical protein